MRIAICPGSFDPITLGHLDIIRRAAQLFDKLIVLVADNPAKTTLFSAEERLSFIKENILELPNVEVETYCGLIADYARSNHAIAIVRGLRAMTDFEYEFQMALTNKKLYPEGETVFLTTRAENLYLSSSLVKQLARYGGEVSDVVPAVVNKALNEKFKK